MKDRNKQREVNAAISTLADLIDLIDYLEQTTNEY